MEPSKELEPEINIESCAIGHYERQSNKHCTRNWNYPLLTTEDRQNIIQFVMMEGMEIYA